jgi:hypothetical protein
MEPKKRSSGVEFHIFSKRKDLLVSQNCPVVPDGQTHLNEPGLVMHEPPLRQLNILQKSTWV